jgi:hypothetical protein
MYEAALEAGVHSEIYRRSGMIQYLPIVRVYLVIGPQGHIAGKADILQYVPVSLQAVKTGGNSSLLKSPSSLLLVSRLLHCNC